MRHSIRPWKDAFNLGLGLVMIASLGVVVVHRLSADAAPVIGPCGLDNEAFCESFDAPSGNGGRTGDLNSVLWGASRLGETNPSQG